MEKIILLLGFFSHTTYALWSCTSDLDCSTQAGSICVAGSCQCPAGQQAILGGTTCVGIAPYHNSPCFDDTQCSSLWTNYECHRSGNDTVGICKCQEGNHYFLGRCWRPKNFREPCHRDEECITVPRNPYSLKCDGVCVCADGYYERQRGECRKIARAINESCVIDEDCQFENGICNINTFMCVDPTSTTATVPPSLLDQYVDTSSILLEENIFKYVDAVHNTTCNTNTDCNTSEQCNFGVCVCPRGFYRRDNRCYAELGSPSTPEQCIGLLAVVINGRCTCPANFFFEENMIDCVKVSRRITDSCVSDASCHTFGAQSRCGPPKEPWGMRTCECITENAVWSSSRNMCRLFAGVGEECESDNDCLAGELEITCVQEQGVGFCRCPPHLTEMDGLCLEFGRVLDETCQVNAECNGTANAVCTNSKCTCTTGFQQQGATCAPIIGGPCSQDSDCIIQDTVCRNATGEFTCQCLEHLVPYDQVCYTVSSGINATCTISAQCTASLGESSSCVDGLCSCAGGHHYRDGRCWPVTGLFETCSRSSQCYLPGNSEIVLCRNGRCQCDFQHPYSEELKTCTSSATTLLASIVLTLSVVLTFVRN